MTKPTKLTNQIYYNKKYQKYAIKRPKLTSQQFHDDDHQCPRCESRHFICERPLEPRQKHYRSYGYLTRRVLWKIRCGTPSCAEPYAVILKLTEWDSAE